jgi:peptide/nickel transport system substrate-binding protein
MLQKRKFLSLVLCLMIVGLIASLISGCAPSGNGGDGDDVEIPQYGGELTLAIVADPIGWDDCINPHYNTSGPYECLWSGDWAKGPAGGYGTGKCDWAIGELNRLEHKSGYIAESYEIHDDYIIFHLRDGVKFHDKYPCNGRELTADDVVFSLERQMTLDTAYLKKSYPQVAAAMTISKVDEDTVRIDCDSEQMPELLTLIDFMYIYPKDVIELYGDMNDWERAIGTGAFTLKEYVPGSSMYYQRNPDWWMINPIGPGEGDQLPYIDGYTALIQPDFATQDSLFRTGQVDTHYCDCIRAEELKDLPGVEYKTYFETANARVIFMRLDKEDKPWADVRVRQAMQLAIDNQKLVDQLYNGDGEILYWPVYYCKEYANPYVPLEDLDDDTIEVLPGESISVADLFGYNLELAQELMAEAGYPTGFQAQVDVYNYYIDLDSLQVVVNMLAEIGIELTINAVDYATWTGTQFNRSYNDMLYGLYAGIGSYFKGINWSSVGVSDIARMFNASNIDDPVLNEYRDQMLAAYPDEAEVDSIHREMLPYLMEQCYVIQTAGPNTYRLWWPWVKNYSGEASVGYYKTINPDRWAYVWIDQELKEDMGY